jgi:hypothetical protein
MTARVSFRFRFMAQKRAVYDRAYRSDNPLMISQVFNSSRRRDASVLEHDSIVAVYGDCQRAAYGSHLLFADGSDKAGEPCFFHSLDVIEVNRGVRLQTFLDSDDDFAGDTVNR